MYLASYRKFRPVIFEDVIGQDHITKTLQNQVKSGNISHAYLFTGSRGTGKTTCAKIFARSINCLHPQNGSPCGKCEVCLALNEQNNTDIIEMDAASNNRVDEIRDLREKVKYLPIVGKKKVYIIDEVHMLTDSAFNALLKTLEEPPSHVVFILATTEVHKLPATILSRCTRFDFHLIELDVLQRYLKNIFNKENIIADEESILAICKAGEGSVRDTLSIADSVSAFCDKNITYDKTKQVIGLSKIDSIFDIVDSIVSKNVLGLFESIKACVEESKNISVLSKEICEYLKNIILIKTGVENIDVLKIMPNDLPRLKEVSLKAEVYTFINIFEKISAVELDLKYSLNPRILLESTCLSCMEFEKKTKNLTKKPEKDSVENNKLVEESQNNDIIEENLIVEEIQNNEIDDKVDTNLFDENIQKMWGHILIKTKESGYFALYTALEGITKMIKTGDTFVLTTNDKSCFELLNDTERKRIILEIANSVDEDLKKINLVFDDSIKTIDEKVHIFKNHFGDILKIKE